MLTFKRIKIKSSIKDYTVIFTSDFSKILAKETVEKPFIIIDKNIFNLYNKQLIQVLKGKKYVVIEAKERNKSLDKINSFIKLLINNNIKKTNKIIAIGGGIIHDIAGFTSSILFRGIEWDCYPTTLLAQSDSCIGSKTSINIEDFKNQVGSYYPPNKVILDTNFLKTLKPSDIKSGLGEIIKVHLLDGEESLEYIKKYDKQIFSDDGMLKDFILRSLIIKKRIIEKDEFDRGYRNILNYGHTFGHAVESISYYKISHGQAVTIGMDMANYISFKRGLLNKILFNKMDEILSRNRPSYAFKKGDVNLLLNALSKDKKNINKSSLSAILTKGPGEMFKIKIPFDNNLKRNIIDFISKNKYSN